MTGCLKPAKKNTCVFHTTVPVDLTTDLPSLYEDQLTLTERHLDSLIEDTDASLKLLTTLSNSFKDVETQTTSFKSQCEELIVEQKRLQKLADDVGTDLHYYAYLDNVTRRLNAPGAGRLVDDDAFVEVLENLDSCITFMGKHVRRDLPSLFKWLLTGRSRTTEKPSRTSRDTSLCSPRRYICLKSASKTASMVYHQKFQGHYPQPSLKPRAMH